VVIARSGIHLDILPALKDRESRDRQPPPEQVQILRGLSLQAMPRLASVKAQAFALDNNAKKREKPPAGGGVAGGFCRDESLQNENTGMAAHYQGGIFSSPLHSGHHSKTIADAISGFWPKLNP